MNSVNTTHLMASTFVGRGEAIDRRRVLNVIASAGALALVGHVVATGEVDARSGRSLKTTSALNVRSGPSTSHKVLLVIPEGAHVFDNGKNTDGFRKVTYADTRGWASSNYLTEGSHIPGEAGPVIGTRVTTTSVNVRSGPSTGDGVIRVLAQGTTVEITETVVDGFRFSYVQGSGGWIYDDYLGSGGDAGGTTLTVTTALNLRAEPSTSARILAVMPEGSTVQGSGKGANGFAYVSYNGTWGWAWVDYLNE